MQPEVQKTGVSEAPQKEFMSSKFFLRKITPMTDRKYFTIIIQVLWRNNEYLLNYIHLRLT